MDSPKAGRPSFASARAIPGLLRLMRVNRTFLDADRARKHLRERSVRPRPYGPPRRLRSDVEIAVGRRDGWPIYTLTPKRGRARGAVVYTHGGGWVNEISPQHWGLCADIAAEAGLAVTVPIYPLVPFATAAEVVPVIAEIALEQREQYGNVCLAGDSAGGQIALSATVLLRDAHGARLPRTVLIAPALDLSMNNPEIDIVLPTDPWLGRHGIQVFIEHWRGELPLDDPIVSPLCAEFDGLGPLTVFCGSRDIVYPDTKLLVDKARGAGVDVEFHDGVGLVHVYPLTPTPEGKAARKVICERLNSTFNQ